MVPYAAILFFSAAAYGAAPDTRAIDRPLDRLERRIVDARNNGKITAEQYDRFEAGMANLYTMREEAVADGALSATEKATIRRAIRELEVEVAEARFGARPAEEIADNPEDRAPDHPAASVHAEGHRGGSGSAL